MSKYHVASVLPLDVVAEGINEWKGSLPIGASSKIMNSLNHLDQSSVAAAVDLLEHEHELGRWGRPASIASAMELDASQSRALDKFRESAVVDHVCKELESRNRDVPVPPPSTRDAIEAAFSLHSGE